MYTPWLIPEGHEYQYDLGWLVRKLLSFETELNTAIDLKTIHYADPLQWDITTQYSPNTVVVDPKTGTAYMSKKPVPAGVQLTNTDYWVVVFNYQRIYDKIMSGVAFNDQDNLEASKDIQKYDFVWFGGDLYQAQRDIPQGSKYIPDVNIVSATIADALAAYYGDTRTAAVTSDTVTVAETQTIAAKNRVINVTGDQTIAAKNRVINVTGDQTITAGDIAETSENRTITTTADYHVDVNGNMSDHVDGVTTKNYGSSLDVSVTGTYTADYRSDATETYAGKRNVSVQGMKLTLSDKTLPIVFPDRTIDLYNIQAGLFKSVKSYGAIGDGVNDDTAAIQACINENRLVYFPSGTYLVSTGSTSLRSNPALQIPSNTWIIGNDATIKLDNNNYDGYSILLIADATNITIEHIKILGDADTHTGTSGEWGNGISLDGARDITIQDCDITRCWGDGIYISEWDNSVHNERISILNCYIHNNRRNGISIEDCQNINISFCTISDQKENGTAPFGGIVIEPYEKAQFIVSNVIISNNIFNHIHGAAIQSSAPTTTGVVYNVMIANNHIANSGIAIISGAIQTTPNCKTLAINNFIQGCPIIIGNSNSITFKSNLIDSCSGTTGITLNTWYSEISDNTFSRCSFTTLVDCAKTLTKIIGNVIEESGIKTVFANVSAFTIINNNNIRLDNIEGNVITLDTNTTRSFISNNVVYCTVGANTLTFINAASDNNIIVNNNMVILNTFSNHKLPYQLNNTINGAAVETTP